MDALDRCSIIAAGPRFLSRFIQIHLRYLPKQRPSRSSRELAANAGREPLVSLSP